MLSFQTAEELEKDKKENWDKIIPGALIRVDLQAYCIALFKKSDKEWEVIILNKNCIKDILANGILPEEDKIINYDKIDFVSVIAHYKDDDLYRDVKSAT